MLLQDCKHRRAADLQFLCDLIGRAALSREAEDLRGLGTSGGRSALVLALTLSLGDALPLPLQHQLPLELRNGAHKVEQELARERGGVEVHAEDAQAHLPASESVRNRHEISHRAGQTVQASDHQHVTLTSIVHSFVQDLPVPCCANLLAEQALNPCGLEITFLRLQTGSLVGSGCTGIADDHGEPSSPNGLLEYVVLLSKNQERNVCWTGFWLYPQSGTGKV